MTPSEVVSGKTVFGSQKHIENTRKLGWHFDGEKECCIYCGSLRMTSPLLPCPCKA
jgi:hypothetical protein